MTLPDIRYGKLALVAAVGAYLVYVVLNPYAWHVIDGANLLIHEAGHFVFTPLGTAIGVFGGTFLQLLIPTLFAVYFLWQRQEVEYFVTLIWIGQNLINVSVYVGDAIAMRLPMLAEGLIHDWNYMLSNLGLLKFAPTISGFFYGLGWTAILAGIGFGAYFAINKRREIVSRTGVMY